MTIKIHYAPTFNSHGAFWAECSYEQSRWLGDQGWWFFGRRSKRDLADKLGAAGVPVNSRWLAGSRLEVVAQLLGAENVEWEDAALRMVERIAAAQEASRAVDADIDVPSPEGLEYRGYQRAGIAFALEAFSQGRRGVLIGDEMGLGKTMQGIGIAVSLQAARTLVVCPASLTRNWKREIEKWWPEAGDVAIVDGGAVDTTARVVVMNYEKAVGRSKNAKAVREAVLATDWGLVIVDEAHMLKNPKAQRTQFYLGKFERGVLKAEGMAQRAERFVLLTGTPMPNRMREMTTLLRTIGAIGEGGPWRKETDFLFAHCGATKSFVPGRGTVWDFSGASKLDEFQAKLRNGFMVRRLKADVATELPPKVRKIVPCRMPEGYGDDLHRGKAVTFDGKGMLIEGASMSFEELAAYRAALAERRQGVTIEYIQEQLEMEQQVLVFAHHQTLLDAIEAAFPASIRIDGSTPPAKRQELVDRFQSDDTVRVAVLSTHAAGVGLTLTAARTVIFAEADWNPSWCVQAEDRAHRIGQTADQVIAHYLVIEETLDARVINTMVRKLNIADRALDRQVEKAAPAAPKKRKARARQEPAARREVTIRTGTYVVTEDVKLAAAEALLHLRALCDGASTRDGEGFNGRDAQSAFVQGLVADARAGVLTDKRAAWALKVLRTYRKTQLAHLADRLFVEEV